MYPILEFDPTREALIEPSRVIKPRDVPEHCVLCFFHEAIDAICGEGRAKTIASFKWEDGPHRVYELEVEGRRLAVAHPGIGGPMAAGMLEEIIALGCRKFIACGGAGVLDRRLAVGHLLIPTSALRDEGTSFHYLPPAREVSPSPEAVAAIERVLNAEQVEYLLCKTWTTDAPYRETRELIRRRREEGCLTVEMEAASFFAVAQFREIMFGQILYGGDDVSGTDWDHRSWTSHATIRERLFWLAAQACLSL
ncbi:MAG: nucleoside phosphorylase [Anaerolineae bacterium]